ncbi:MAG: glycosyltransferase family 2 protein [Chitinispirillaceae bacterium]
MKPSVTVMMPAKNEEKYIRYSVDSILHQTYPDWELIIVDDGSTDNTKEIASGYSRSEKRIKVVNGPKECAAAARNRAIEIASGDYIMNMDADDISHEKRIELLLEEAVKNNNSVVGSNLHFVDDSMEVKRTLEKPGGNADIRAGFRRLRKRHTFIPGTLLASSHLLKKTGYNEMYKSMEDWDLILRLSEMPEVVFTNVQKPLYLYRINEGSMSLQHETRSRYHLLLIFNQFRRRRQQQEFQSIVAFLNYMNGNWFRKLVCELMLRQISKKQIRCLKRAGHDPFKKVFHGK